MDCSVLSIEGKPTSLISLWRSRKIVLCFLRQLGCRFCMQRTKKLMSVQDKFHEAGIKLVLVSLGTPLQGQKFINKTGFQGELYVDPSSDGKVRTALNSNQAVAYNFFKLKRGKEVVLNPHTKKLATELTSLGFDNWSDLVENVETNEQGGIMEWAGDPFQIGGTFVLGAGNCCDYMYRSAYAGDHPPLGPLVEAATGKNINGEEVTHPTAVEWASKLAANVRYRDKNWSEERKFNKGTIQSNVGQKSNDDTKVTSSTTSTTTSTNQSKTNDDNTMRWKMTAATVYGAVLAGTCTQLRNVLPFEIQLFQDMAIIRYWPEFIFSQILLGIVAIIYELMLLEEEEEEEEE
jgi:peroxiredoxin